MDVWTAGGVMVTGLGIDQVGLASSCKMNRRIDK